MNRIDETENDEMNYTQFYVIEDEGPRKCRLSLWRNDKNKLVVEICDNEDPSDMYMYQSAVMDVDDALALYEELQSIVQDMQTENAFRESDKQKPLSDMTNPSRKVDEGTHSTMLNEAPEENPIPQWRQKEKQQQLKLITA